MKCPCCGAAELIRETRDLPYTHKGVTFNIPEVTGDFCPACGEVVLPPEIGEHYNELAGMLWWSKQDEATRLHWLQQAGDTGVPADAWEAFQLSNSR